MKNKLNQMLLVSSAAIISLVSTDQAVLSQERLPEITVTAPSPIRRPASAPARPAPAQRAPTAAPAAAPSPPTPVAIPSSGILPVVVDQFATVTVVPNEELRRTSASTIGDLLQNKPGITGSSFAPGASSRPIIRGLDVNRVGIVENGIGGGGVSDLGEDHYVPINPLATNQVEVIRCPATMRYGSGSIGGVVSATDNRIPEAYPPCWQATPARTDGLITKAPASAKQAGCVNVETRGAVSTVDNGREGGALLDAAGSNFAIHADAFARAADDYRVPKDPYSPTARANTPGLAPFNGKQPNSSLRMDGASGGGSYIFDGGFIGAAVIQDNALYHIPGIDGDIHGTRIDSHQTRFVSKGEFRSPTTAIDTIRFWAGVTDYKHKEIGFATEFDHSTDGVRQTFINREQEGRVETTLKPVNLGFAQMTTAVGVQGGHQYINAPGDDPTSVLNGLMDPNRNSRIASYIFNEFKFSETTKAQVAGRIERVWLNGTTPLFPSDVFDVGANPGSIGPSVQRNLAFTPKSASAGVIQNFQWDLVGSITAQYVERSPKPAELFSRGPHDATATFDIGNPDLKIEVAKSVEAGIRRATGPFRFELTAYYTRFDGFIFRSLTGNTCDGTACFADADHELKQARYSQRDTIFRGGEFQFQYDVAPLWSGTWGVEGQWDVVRATFTDGTNVPRIPPMRFGGGVFWRDPNWFARVNVLHALAQNQIAAANPVTGLETETTTPGYNDLRAEVSYRWLPKRRIPGELSEWRVGLVGTNLLNDDIRNAVSYTKDEVLLPGRSVRFFANVKY
ncbi:MAG: iron complex outerrane recepter protein [Mycobacterium sp.]|uniref:TonB-dependent receptor n=1 Tax=Mycobacterium sp. TaxID=1785 RepID=UPI0028B3D1F8|nr:TonB-dependent receptor [Mycobacterium sp.]MDT5116208.1 iron complex outerrane recepter protein [Mycobacterium sp.]